MGTGSSVDAVERGEGVVAAKEIDNTLCLVERASKKIIRTTL